MRVDGARARRNVVAPHLLEQLFAARDAAGTRREVLQQVELDRREVHELAVARAPGALAASSSIAPIRTDALASLVGRALGAAQQRVHARDELARAERLRHVVVGADGEPDEQIGLAVAGGEHQDRQRALALDLLAHLDAVETGEHEVEHDEVGPDALAELDAARAVARDLDLVALAAQPGRRRPRRSSASSSITAIRRPAAGARSPGSTGRPATYWSHARG